MIKKATRVLIAHKHHTEKTVGVSPSMEKMIGNTYVVEEMRDVYNAYIRDKHGSLWVWNINDLKPVRLKKKKIKPELFNPENLIGKE